MSEGKLSDSTLVADPIVELSVRAINCLHNDGIRTIGAVRAMTDAELLRIPNLGRRTLREVRWRIGEYDPAAAPVLRAEAVAKLAETPTPERVAEAIAVVTGASPAPKIRWSPASNKNGDMPRAERNCANCDHSRLAGRELRCWSQPPTPCTIGFQRALEGELPRPIIIGVLPPTFPWYCCPKWEHMAADHPDFGVKELVSEVDTMVSAAETRQ